LIEDNKTIMIYGGWDPNGEDDNDSDIIFEDCFLLDTEKWAWRKGPKPVFAGVALDSEGDNGGAKRVGHDGLLMPSEDGTEVVVFGGRTPTGMTGDFQTLAI